MRKIVFFLALIISVNVFSTRYLVDLGSGNTWTNPSASGGTRVDLSSPATNFATWFNGTTMSIGDEVWIAGGTYVVAAAIALKDGVNIYGGFTGTETAVSGRNSNKGPNAWDFSPATVIDFNNINPGTTGLNCAAAFVNATVVDGLSVTKVAKSLTSGNGSIGAIIGTITLQNCIFYANKFTRSSGTTTVSGGLFARTGSKIENCYFYNNQTLSGDANISNIRGAALALAGDVSVKGCTFENNTSISNGGAVIIMSNSASHSGGGAFENCIFRNNTAGSQGGAIHSAISQNQTGNFSLKNCQFIDNSATVAPAVNITNVSFTNNVAIDGCLFARNTATTGSGAVFIAANTSITVQYIKNCIFRDNKNNTAGQAGAALNLSRPTTVSNCIFANNSGLNTLNLGIANINVYNCTFTNNVSESGGAALNIANVNATFKNNIFWGNTAYNILPGTGVLTTGYNAFDDDESAQAWYGEGSIKTLTADNTFVTPTSFTGSATTESQKTESNAANWNLKSGCTAINKGADLSAAGVTTDILGNARPTGSGAVDMGAYEGIFVTTNQNVSSYATNSDINVSVGGHLTVDAIKTVKSITVAPGAKITVNAALTATNGITLESDATGTATLMDSYTEPTINATVKQYVTAGRNWYMSVPLNNTAAFSVLDKGTSVVEYNETTGLWPAITSGTLTRGKGYVQAALSTEGTTGTVTFSGTTNSGDVPVTLTYTSDKGKGYNLVGNPYPSYLSWSAVAADNAAANMPTGTMWYRTINYNSKSAWTPNTTYNVNDIVYNGNRFYKVTTGGTSAASGGPSGSLTGITDGSVVWDYEGSVYQFATVSALGVATPSTVSNMIPPMQAFWVKSNGGTLTFKNTMRSHNAEGSNVLKAPKISNAEMPLVRLQLTNGVSADEVVICTNVNASNAFDVYDAPKYFNTSGSNQPELYTQAGNEKLAINAMNEIIFGSEIPLGFLTEKANKFSVSASEIKNIDAKVSIILKDKVLNTEFNLTNGEAYNFSSDATNSTDRFSLIFRAPGVTTGFDTVAKSNVQVYVNTSNQIVIAASEKTKYAVYNAVGMLIGKGQTSDMPENINCKLNPGVYYVQMLVNDQSDIRKIIIR